MIRRTCLLVTDAGERMETHELTNGDLVSLMIDAEGVITSGRTESWATKRPARFPTL